MNRGWVAVGIDHDTVATPGLLSSEVAPHQRRQRRQHCPWDQQVEQDRASANLVHQSQLARTPVTHEGGLARAAAAGIPEAKKNSKIKNVSRYGDAGPGPKGSVMTGTFELQGQEFIALNGGTHFKFTEAVSFLVNCETQEEVDELWDKLSAGGQPGQCGWLKDRYGLSWQIVPTILGKLMQDKDPQKSQRVMQALMQMRKIDIAGLERAYAGS